MRRAGILAVLIWSLAVFVPRAPAFQEARAEEVVDVTIEGHWAGAIEVPGTALEVEVDFRRQGDAWEGEISIPAQGASDLPLVEIEVDGDRVRFAIRDVPGDPTFSGTVDGDALRGEFTQGGATFPFELTRGEDRAALARRALEGIDPIVDKALEDFSIPGLAMAVVVDDEVVLSRGYGLRDVEGGEPVTEDTLFAIGSTTKAFTAFVLGTLVDEGKLDWDDPVIEHLPDFRLRDPHATRRLKVRDLLSHSSGLPRHDLLWYNSPLSRQELYSRLAHLEPTRDLGERYQYQNLMFMTAGHLAERLTGRSWEELVRERVFEPLGMERSNFSVEDSQRDPDHALPYNVEDGEADRIPFRNIDAVGPAGSINSSVAEMSHWMRMQLAGGEFGGERLVEESTLEAMHTPHMALAAYPDEQRTMALAYGLGWVIESHRGHFVVQHGGGIDGFISWVALLPHDDLGVVVYTNGSGLNPLPTAVARTVIDRILGLEDGGYLERALERAERAAEAADEAEANAEVRRKEGTSPSHPLADYAGKYDDPGYGTIEVTMVMPEGEEQGQGEPRLRLVYNGMPVWLEHWHHNTFNGVAEEGADPTLEDMKFLFRLDVDGEVSELVAPFEPTAAPVVFEKRPDERLFDPEYLSRFVGVYELRSQRITVTLHGDRLRVSLPGQPTYELEPVRGTEFRMADLEGFGVEFLVDADGNVTGARFIQPGGIFEAEHVQERGEG